jgi:hypothetical protein
MMTATGFADTGMILDAAPDGPGFPQKPRIIESGWFAASPRSRRRVLPGPFFSWETLCSKMGIADGAPALRLRDNVWRKLILDEGDSVAQPETAFFQALNLDEVRTRDGLQCFNCRI